MFVTRRGFTGGALSVALGAQLSAPAFGQGRPPLSAAIAAIRTYGEAHRSQFTLPGLTLGLRTPDGFVEILNFGYANADARTPITPDTLFQIGSISKVMTASVVHQLAAEGRFDLTDRVSTLVPAFPLPTRNAITVQHLLDHTAGLPGDAPLFPRAGCGPLMPRESTGIIATQDTTCWASLPSISVANRWIASSRNGSSRPSGCAGATAQSSVRTERNMRRAMRLRIPRRRSPRRPAGAGSLGRRHIWRGKRGFDR